MDWWNLMKQSVTVGAQLLRSGRYGCNNGRYGCTIVMSYIGINKAVSQWLLTFNLCVSVTWPLTCAFHISCTHTSEIIDMHRGMCDNVNEHTTKSPPYRTTRGWCYSTAREAQPRVQLSNTSLEWFIFIYRATTYVLTFIMHASFDCVTYVLF